MFIFRLILSIVPLALTPLLGFFIAEGYLNFGGGEKDLFLLIPWMVWSVVYFVLFLILWRRKFSITKGRCQIGQLM